MTNFEQTKIPEESLNFCEIKDYAKIVDLGSCKSWIVEMYTAVRKSLYPWHTVIASQFSREIWVTDVGEQL